MKNVLLIIYLFISSSFLFGQQVLTSYKIEAGQKITAIHISAFSKDSKYIVGKIQSIRGSLITLSLAENTEYKVTLNNEIIFTIPPMTLDELNLESPNTHLLEDLLNPVESPIIENQDKVEENIEVKVEEKSPVNTEKSEENAELKTNTPTGIKSEEKSEETNEKQREENSELTPTEEKPLEIKVEEQEGTEVEKPAKKKD